VVRSLAEMLGTITFMIAIANLPLASASAVVQAAPLAVTLAAALFLREPVGWQRWAAILVGFAGMLVMLRPGTDAFDPVMLVAVLTVVCIVVRDMATRLLPDRVPALYAASQTAAIITVFGGLLLPFEGFVAPDPVHLGAYAVAAVCCIAGYTLGVSSVRVGDISAVSPFRYTVLVFSVALGYLVFSHVPDAATFVGATIVVAAGLFTLWRESRVSAMRPAASAPVREFVPE
jgi:drug/metabolite transporter (DMT)-like permease